LVYNHSGRWKKFGEGYGKREIVWYLSGGSDDGNKLITEVRPEK